MNLSKRLCCCRKLKEAAKRKAEKAAQGDNFEAIAREWLALQEPKLAPATFAKAGWTLETFIFPGLGKRPISKITAPDLLGVLRKIEVRGTYETAHRAKQRCGQVFRYAIATGRAVHDITADLRGALAPLVTTNHAAITDPARVGELLRAIDGYRGNSTTAYALRLAPLTFVQPGELRHATWSEFDLDHAEWRIPAERMKMREQNIVPLSRQAVDLTPQSVRLPRAWQRPPTDEREHRECRAAAARVRARRDDRPRLPLHGLDPAQRARLASGFDRSATRTRRAAQGASRLQPRTTLGRAAQDDAILGGLSGSAQARDKWACRAANAGGVDAKNSSSAGMSCGNCFRDATAPTSDRGTVVDPRPRLIGRSVFPGPQSLGARRAAAYSIVRDMDRLQAYQLHQDFRGAQKWLGVC